MRAIQISVGPLVTASSSNIALSQSLTAAGKLTLNGTLVSAGIAILDTPRNILIHSDGNDSGLTWTITGTNWAGNSISEPLLGTDTSDSISVLDYATVTAISGNKAAASTVTAGTTTTAGSQWVRFDEWAEAVVGMQFTVTGTIAYTFQGSFDDPNSLINPIAPYLMAWDSTISPVVGASTSLSANLAAAPLWGRVLLVSGTGSVRGSMAQYLQVPTT